MEMTATSANNHYVPCVYLKNFVRSDGRILKYRILVSRTTVRLWKPSFLSAVGCYRHLYTRTVSEAETDEIERWFNVEFETPAQEALRKATQESRLTTTDWRHLVLFLAAQDVRTPASIVEYFQAMHDHAAMVQDSLDRSVCELESASKTGEVISIPRIPYGEYMPMRVIVDKQVGQDSAKLQAEVLIGRGSWLFAVRHLLTSTADVLLNHKWTILKPPPGLHWFTSDDPVVKLNYSDPENYDFKGGWRTSGTEIFLPLSPQHLLYTRIDDRVPQRGTSVSSAQALLLRRFIAKHAYQFIFAIDEDPDVPTFRPRVVDTALFHQESEKWRTWHTVQSVAERRFAAGVAVDTANENEGSGA